jgi:hypothetical protein
VDFRKGAKLDPTQVEDRRGMRGMRGGRGVAVGGGAGVVGIVLVLLITLLGGDNIDLSALQSLEGVIAGGQQQQGEVIEECKTGADAEKSRDCRLIGAVNSIQAYWGEALDGYRPAVTVFFSDSTNTGCGFATADVGPFYCPPDQKVYIDLGFFQELQARFGAEGGPFAEAYVLAHEYGHHVQNLVGTLSQIGGDRSAHRARRCARSSRPTASPACGRRTRRARASSPRSATKRSRRRWTRPPRSGTTASRRRSRDR